MWLSTSSLDYHLMIQSGDLGQTYDSAATLEHYLQSYGQSVLFLGDLAYQDNYPFHYQVRFDTWSRFVERSVAYQPWIWTSGNHEIDYVPEIVSIVMKLLLRSIATAVLSSTFGNVTRFKVLMK